MDNLKRIGILALVFLLFFSSLKTTVLMGIYSLDSVLFVELFCENQDKPELQCNGSCELSRIAQQNAGHSEDAALLDFFQQEIIFVADSSPVPRENIFNILSEKDKIPFTESRYSPELEKIKDRPPIWV